MLRLWLKNGIILKFRKLFDVVHKVQSNAIFRFMFRFGMKSRHELCDWETENGLAMKIKESGLNGVQFYEA